jgi:hypothetical protein
MKISEILWKAANEHLWVAGDAMDERTEEFSCHAIARALHKNWRRHRQENHPAMRFVRQLGCDPDASGWSQAIDRDPQGARYAWLMFASMYAEELGL